jgi:glycosyltransferase involved in cell wall biosynthesis
MLNYGVSSKVTDMLVETPGRNLQWDQRDIDVLWVSNFRQLKRPELFLELVERCPEYRMHMVGGPDPNDWLLYENSRQRAVSLSSIKFHGQIPYHDIGSIYDRAKIFVNTSEVEGFPNSFLQSWRRGIPVVSFFDPNGLIRREGLGYIVQSIDEMRSTVRKMLSNFNEWHHVSVRCLRYMDEFHTDDLVISPYLQAFSDAYSYGVG